ncbi:RRM domain protein, partial [Trachipleistophora hominis]
VGDRDSRRDNDRFRSYERDRGDMRGGNRGMNPPSPPPSKVLGIFGIPVSIAHEELVDFLKYHIPSIPYQSIHLVKDRQTNLSRGFAFVYFDTIEDSTLAKDALVNKEIHNKRVRVDFAIGDGQRPPPKY